MIMHHFSLPNKNRKGVATIIGVLFFVIILSIIVFGFSYLAIPESRVVKIDLRAKQSYFLTEASLEDAIYRLIQGKQYNSTETLTLNGSSATAQINNLGGNQYQVIATGNVGQAVRKVEATLQTGGTLTSFNYGAQVGYLGLEMENTATINGSVYSNGNIVASSNTQITGDAWVARGTATNPDQQQTTQTGTINLRSQQNNQDGAQSFVPAITAHVNKVSLYIRKVGNPGDATIRIVADNGGKPDDNNSFANGQLNSSLVTTNFAWVDVTLNSNDPVLQNQTYWIVIDNGGWNATRYYTLGTAVDSSYGDGTFKYTQDWSSGSAVWTGINQDSAFKVFLGDTATKIDGATIGGHAHANTIENATITGDAYYQTISGSTVGGTSYPGSSDPNPQNLPISQAVIDQFKADGDAGGICIQPQCDVNGDYMLDNSQTDTIGPIQIPGNMEVKNQAVLTVTGTIHVRGDLTFENTCTVKLDPSYGPSSGVIVVDGKIKVKNTCDLLGSGVGGSYLMMITTSPLLGGPPALDLDNTSAGAIFYASEGAIEISNSASVKEAVGQKLKIKNTASLTYESGLANVNFSSGPSGGWEITNWREIE